MKITIELDLDNDAYQQTTFWVPLGVGRLYLDRRNLNALLATDPKLGADLPIIDPNGNKVGIVTVMGGQ